MLRAALAVAVVLAFATSTPGVAQDAGRAFAAPVLTIDQDRLFAETNAGLRINAEIEAEAERLAAENARIEAELIKRERELTELRPTLAPAEFRSLADEFDNDVERIRQEQDAKARAITEQREAARQSFVGEAAEVISSIVRERGALIVLDRRDVFLSADSIDITDEAIQRINEAAEGR